MYVSINYAGECNGRVRFSTLHGRHGHFNIAIVAIDLFLKVFLAFFEMA